ncbi:uncharacterized protein LOC132932367 [Rhopalosiphum padi]|uniref:uncharacterized protein LOC132932367 n=1 Tax=Rhopalosiphum padi TaxID=40932 RepID=UPI00298EA5DE|nr:uncharacterized protein LOC132932367 [Rhopalosiphum padi]
MLFFFQLKMEQESLVKRNPRGKFVCSRQREMIINAYKSKLEKNPSMTIRNMRSTLSKELGIGETTISNTISQYRQHETVSSPNKTKKFKNIETKINDFDKSEIRKKIHKFWFDRELPTLDKILKVINNEDSTLPNFSRTSLYRLLKSMEFKYSKRGRNGTLLEKSEIVLWRRKYLKDIKKYREEGRPIYYLDEMLVNTGGISERVRCNKTVKSLPRDVHTQSFSPGPVNPSSNENRLIVIHIGSEDGFVPGGLLCVESQKNSKDYHDEINGGFFL